MFPSLHRTSGRHPDCAPTRCLHGWRRSKQLWRHAALHASNSRKDVIALGNICLDVVIPVDVLPPPDPEYRRRMLDALTQAPPGQDAWEVGGSCNFMIAAARLGLHVASVAHIGADVYGQYIRDTLQAESITQHQPVVAQGGEHARQANGTLVCFVLVDPHSKHAFNSRYDFGPWPLLQNLDTLPPESLALLHHTRALVANGFVFDELPLGVVQAACREAIRGGAAVFFDPGPRCFTMMSGSRREALDAVMDLSDVVLMTEEEAKIVTGHTDPDLAARFVLDRPGTRTEWCVVKLGKDGALLRSRAEGKSYRMQGMTVEVQDTVGCGDSFAAAIVLGYVARHSIPATLALANAVGAATATGRGAGRNVASAAKVQALLQGAARDWGPELRGVAEEAEQNLAASLGGRSGRTHAAAGQA